MEPPARPYCRAGAKNPKTMKSLQNTRSVISILICMQLLSSSAFSQVVPMITGEEANPISMLDDLTSSLLADDNLNETGINDPSSILEDLGGTTTGDDPMGTESNPGDPSAQDPGVPVDGGLSLLLAAGAAYGARRLRNANKGKGKAGKPERGSGD